MSGGGKVDKGFLLSVLFLCFRFCQKNGGNVGRMTTSARACKAAASVVAKKGPKVQKKKPSTATKPPAPPVYPKVPHRLDHHDDVREDPYYYFRDKKDRRIKKWLGDETEYAKHTLAELCESTYNVVKSRVVHAPSNTCGTENDGAEAQGRLQRDPIDPLPPNLNPNDFQSLQENIFKEMKRRWRETDMSLPTKDRSYWYFARTFEGMEHASYCRVPYKARTTLLLDYAALLLSNPNAELPVVDGEEVMLDVNALQEAFQQDYVEVGDLDVSHDESKVVVSVDLSQGKEIFTLFVMDLSPPCPSATTKRTKQRTKPSTLSEAADEARARRVGVKKNARHIDANEAAAASVVPPHQHHILRQIDMLPASSEVMWLPDDTGFLYFALDDTQRPYRLVFHDLTKPVDSEEADVILFQEDDLQFSCSTLSYTDDEQYISFSVASKLQEETWVMPIADARRLRAFLVESSWSFPSSSVQPVEDNGTPEQLRLEEGDGLSAVRPLNPYTSACPLFRVVKKRELPLEYDVTHVSFSAKVGGSSTGGWIIANNRPPFRNFELAYCLDGDAQPLPADELLPVAKWRPLVAYNDNLKIDHVSSTRHFVVVGCRHNGSPAAFVIPMSVLESSIAAGTTPRSLEDVTFALPASALLENVTPWTKPHADPLLACEETLHVSHEDDDFHRALSNRTDDWRSALIIELSPNSDDYECAQLRIFVHHAIFPARVYLVDFLGPPLLGLEDSGSASTKHGGVRAYFSNRTLLRVEPSGAVAGKTKTSTPVVYDPSAYSVQRVWVPASIRAVFGKPDDETKIPMMIVYRNDTFVPGVNPCLITAYGSYGDCTDPEFSTERLSILDRGIVYAVAQIRGGGEMGRVWRDSGRMEHRHISVQDFVDCSSYLIDHQFSSPHRLCALGGSAGGTIVAAAMLTAPSGLYRAVLPLVPFVDCLTTMLDPSIPLTSAEWEEWGNPLLDKDAYFNIKRYSPMDLLSAAERSIAATTSPSNGEQHAVTAVPQLPRFVFVDSGFGDPRVPHWEPMAFVARLRDYSSALLHARSGTRPMVLHKCNLSAGHGGSSGRYEQLRELADEYAFLIASAYQP